MTTDQPKEVVLAEVQFADPPTGGYTYRVPAALADLEPVIRVRVPFGHRYRVGILVRIFRGEDQSGYRDVIAAVDAHPLIPAEVLALTAWMAEYYLCSWGEALAAAVPRGVKPRLSVRYRLSTIAIAELWLDEESGETAELWRALKAKPLTTLQVKRRFPNGVKLLEQFRKRVWLETVEVEPRRSLVNWTWSWRWSNSVSYDDATSRLPVSARRLRESVAVLETVKGRITQPELSRAHPGMTSAMRALAKRGWVTAERVARDDSTELQVGLAETAAGEPELSDKQRAVVNAISSALQAKTYHPFLLHGVTGSGKSLIYLEAIQAALDAGRSAIVLVPEISLTPQLTGRIQRRFGEVAAVTHSRLSEQERRFVWQMARAGQVRVVIGPRSAVMTPLPDLGLIIVDEEHDDSYKQADPAPRYHGRDVALYRATQVGAVVLLGSATPDVTSYHHALTGKYELLKLTERHGGISLPEVQVVKWGTGGERSVFGARLVKHMTERLGQGEQVILLANRRGFATIIRCPDCGDVARCPNCDITLRYHRIGRKLECHYCGYVSAAVDACPKCHGQRLRYGGVGTQRVQRELEIRFPEKRIARMDLDTTRARGAHQDILARFAAREYDVLLGTQMVAKGHDFPGVTLVGILTADLEWSLPDFRTVERAFRLLLQAAGRAGRSGAGEVIIQALDPSHPVLRWVEKQDYRQLYEAELKFRSPLGYPPFGRLIAIELRGQAQAAVQEAARAIKEKLTAGFTVATLLGPVAPPVERLEGDYRQRMLVKLPARLTKSVKEDKTFLSCEVHQMEKQLKKHAIRLVVDVDPVDV
jgi:primosomal protein N' (replication factor Y)